MTASQHAFGSTVDRLGNTIGGGLSDPWSQAGGNSFHADDFRSPSTMTSPVQHRPWDPVGYAFDGLAAPPAAPR
eukprot:scaffold288_cov44-Cyclotella_meneghiniana.AAC.4